MSTKETIKHHWDADTQSGFHLYTDLMDYCAENDVVHLELNGVVFEADSSGRVEITIPRKWAEMLCLVPPTKPET